MRGTKLLARSLWHYRRSHVAVLLGTAVATATLTGALIVGDSMRGSLTKTALSRLAGVDHALIAQRFVRQALADEIAADPAFSPSFQTVCPLIVLRAGVTHSRSRMRAGRVNIFGVDDTFTQLATGARDGRGTEEIPFQIPVGRTVVLNANLATELGAVPGDDVLLRLSKQGAASVETLMGRRDDTVATLRLEVAAIVPNDGLGDLSLTPQQAPPQNAYVDLSVLQRAIGKADRINALLVVDAREPNGTPADSAIELQQILSGKLSLADIDLRVRVDTERRYLAIESTSMFLEPMIEETIRTALAQRSHRSSEVLTYLANTIEIASADRPNDGRNASIPYSIVTALAEGSPLAVDLASRVGGGEGLAAGQLWLNAWAAKDLDAKLGDTIRLSYYLVGAFGRLETRSSDFELTGVLPMDATTSDPGFAPEYPGITDTNDLSDWDPPFPIDLKMIRDQDELYWDKYRTAPKAFVSLADGQRLWTGENERFGRLTAIRMPLPKGALATQTAAAIERAILQSIDAEKLGLRFEPLRQRFVDAGQGTTDFGGLFIGFSFFLIAAAAMLVALFFRLNAERRSAELGTLLAIGFTPRTTVWWLLSEGLVVAATGAAIGLAGASGYAWLMLAGLRSWWSQAANTPFLTLHVSMISLVIGFVASVGVASASMAWSLRGLIRLDVRALLHGSLTASGTVLRSQRRRFTFIGLLAVLAGAGIAWHAATGRASTQALAFFGSGVCFLVSALAFVRRWLCVVQPAAARSLPTPLGLGLRNTTRHPGRSLLTIGLLASATFLIASMQAFRIQPPNPTTSSNTSGLGGFALVAESGIPLPYDVNTPTGREELGFADPNAPLLHRATCVALRLRPGDESSCLSLYKPLEPRLLGAPAGMIERGGFSFSSTLARNDAERANPWLLLNRHFDDGAIAVIGDEAVVKWQLHLGLGEDLLVTSEAGREQRLRFVALLSGSLLQNEMILSEAQFVRLFPSIGGHAFYLIEATADDAMPLTGLLEEELERFAFDVQPAADRLSAFQGVQNTYLATFQMVGGLGLLLGTIGLSAVLLRNVWERRSELALMRALGFSESLLGTIVLGENVALVIVGVLAGALPAIVAVAPHLQHRTEGIAWWPVAAALIGVVVVGIASGAVALASSLRMSLIAELRRE